MESPNNPRVSPGAAIGSYWAGVHFLDPSGNLAKVLSVGYVCKWGLPKSNSRCFFELCWAYIGVILGLYWGYVGLTLGLYWAYIGVILGLYEYGYAQQKLIILRHPHFLLHVAMYCSCPASTVGARAFWYRPLLRSPYIYLLYSPLNT